jgi:hypothetical protein
MAIFVIFCGYLLYFFLFWYIVARRIWQPWRNAVATALGAF